MYTSALSLCSQKAQTPVRRKGCSNCSCGCGEEYGRRSQQPPRPWEESCRWDVLNSLAASLLAACSAGHADVSSVSDGETHKETSLMLPSAASSPGSPAPLSEPLCGCSSLGTPPATRAWHRTGGTFWQVFASFSTSVSPSSKFTPAPDTCRWHGCQLPFHKDSLLLPSPFFQSFACSALCFMPQILVGGLCICQGTGSSLLKPLGPFHCKHPGFAPVAQLRCLTPTPVKSSTPTLSLCKGKWQWGTLKALHLINWLTQVSSCNSIQWSKLQRGYKWPDQGWWWPLSVCQNPQAQGTLVTVVCNCQLSSKGMIKHIVYFYF